MSLEIMPGKLHFGFFSLRIGYMNSGLTEFQDKKYFAWGIQLIFILQGF